MALTPDNGSEFADDVLQPDSTDDTTDQTDMVAPSKTWKLDFENGRITHEIDGLEAIRQFVKKAILTARSRFLIYTDDYGCELDDLIGDDVTDAYLNSEIPRMVKEALIYDDRIEDVTDIQYERDGDKLYLSFRVVTALGEQEEMGVTV